MGFQRSGFQSGGFQKSAIPIGVNPATQAAIAPVIAGRLTTTVALQVTQQPAIAPQISTAPVQRADAIASQQISHSSIILIVTNSQVEVAAIKHACNTAPVEIEIRSGLVVEPLLQSDMSSQLDLAGCLRAQPNDASQCNFASTVEVSTTSKLLVIDAKHQSNLEAVLLDAISAIDVVKADQKNTHEIVFLPPQITSPLNTRRLNVTLSTNRYLAQASTQRFIVSLTSH